MSKERSEYCEWRSLIPSSWGSETEFLQIRKLAAGASLALRRIASWATNICQPRATIALVSTPQDPELSEIRELVLRQAKKMFQTRQSCANVEEYNLLSVWWTGCKIVQISMMYLRLSSFMLPDDLHIEEDSHQKNKLDSDGMPAAQIILKRRRSSHTCTRFKQIGCEWKLRVFYIQVNKYL